MPATTPDYRLTLSDLDDQAAELADRLRGEDVPVSFFVARWALMIFVEQQIEDLIENAGDRFCQSNKTDAMISRARVIVGKE